MGRQTSEVGPKTLRMRQELQRYAEALSQQLMSKADARGLLHRPKYLAFRSVNEAHFSGRSSSAKMADTGHTGTQAPQSMHSTGSMYSISSSACAGESFLG